MYENDDEDENEDLFATTSLLAVDGERLRVKGYGSTSPLLSFGF